MNWLNKLERKYGRLGIENMMIYITVTMLAVYLADFLLNTDISGWIYFDRDLIMQGQVWRLLSFIFLPPPTSSPIFILFALYFYYFIGGSLEKAWGVFRFNVYYLCGMLGTIIAGFIVGSTGNVYLNLSLFFAFARLFPDHQVLLFFILPIKVKILGYLNWGLFAISFLGALVIFDFATCAAILASVLNFFIFFGKDFYDGYQNWRKYGKQRKEFKRQSGNNGFWR